MNASPLPPIRIATRASPLALWQAGHVAELLQQRTPDRTVEIVHVTTSGDQDRLQPLRQMGGQGVFTREVERTVLDGQADIAVHSLKDLPTKLPEGLSLAGAPPRGPRYDALVLTQGARCDGLEALPQAARIGTGSLRRQAQLLHRRPDLVLEDVRGNIETRLRKLDDGQYDALVLAEAGLCRLGLADRISLILAPPLMWPAAGQAALGIEYRTDDAATAALLAGITDRPTLAEVTAERACLAELRAGCHAPVGVLAVASDDRLTLEAVVLSADGTLRLSTCVDGELSEPAAVGGEAAERLRQLGAEALIKG